MAKKVHCETAWPLIAPLKTLNRYCDVDLWLGFMSSCSPACGASDFSFDRWSLAVRRARAEARNL